MLRKEKQLVLQHLQLELIKSYELESRIENEANNSVMEGNTQDEQENGLASPYYLLNVYAWRTTADG